jgi:hypothetical protein
VATAPELRLGRPAEVTSAPADIASIDAAPDGRLAVLYADRTNEVPVTLIENWPALLRDR